MLTRPIVLNATPAFGHRLYLLRGLVWLLAGAAVGAALAVTAPLFRGPEFATREKLEHKLIRARHLQGLGATQEQIDAFEKEMARVESRREPPPNLAILGAIPMSVGLAYLIFFGLEELRLRRGTRPA